MRMYVVSLAAGVLVGIIYGLLGIRSPAPPVVALVGLFGILLGEQVAPMAKRLLAREAINVGWMKTDCVPHIFGELPTKASATTAANREVQT
jgi:XapX domain-containing protein